MGRKHSELLRLVFPNQKGNGIDLPLSLSELKEENNKERMFTLRKKDNMAKFIIFYSWNDDCWFYCEQKNIPIVMNNKRGVRLSYVKKNAFFVTNDVVLIQEKEKEIEKLVLEGKI